MLGRVCRSICHFLSLLWIGIHIFQHHCDPLGPFLKNNCSFGHQCTGIGWELCLRSCHKPKDSWQDETLHDTTLHSSPSGCKDDQINKEWQQTIHSPRRCLSGDTPLATSHSQPLKEMDLLIPCQFHKTLNDVDVLLTRQKHWHQCPYEFYVFNAHVSRYVKWLWVNECDFSSSASWRSENTASCDGKIGFWSPSKGSRLVKSGHGLSARLQLSLVKQALKLGEHMWFACMQGLVLLCCGQSSHIISDVSLKSFFFFFSNLLCSFVCFWLSGRNFQCNKTMIDCIASKEFCLGNIVGM